MTVGASCEHRSNRWLDAGIFTLNKVREFHYSLAI
jgi:hypothetical protein